MSPNSTALNINGSGADEIFCSVDATPGFTSQSVTCTPSSTTPGSGRIAFGAVNGTSTDSVSIAYTGVVSADVSRNVPVVSLASGRVSAIHVRLGDTVKKGQLLMTVRSDDVSGGYSNYRMAVADETLARTQYERSKDLYEHGAEAKLAELNRTLELYRGGGRASALELPLAEYQQLSMELARGPAIGRLGEHDPDDVASAALDPSALFAEAELRGHLVKAIQSLPERSQQVLALYYQHDCTQAEIGKVLGVTESRVCQILGEATARLRAKLASQAIGPTYAEGNE